MSAINRLKLDFSLTTTEERTEFLTQYLKRPEFVQHPPTSDELETMSNYVLWGKDPTTGLNAQQAGLVDLETKHGTWDKNANVESLEQLMEQPTFNEASLLSLDAPPPIIRREVFSRKQALAQCPSYLTQPFNDLFRQIDELDLAINYYELAHNRRTNPPRAQLLARFTPEEQAALNEKASHWNQYHYLKVRHQLVDLRREQYTLRDSFQRKILLQDTPTNYADAVGADPQIDCDIEVLPLGTQNSTDVSRLVFRPWTDVIPAAYSEDDLAAISTLYWAKQSYSPSPYQRYIDFRDPDHVYQILQLFNELDDAAASPSLESNLPALLNTLRFYVERAELTELQREILDMKLSKVKNTDIAPAVNKKWHKTYTPNYISTIFRQRIIPKINEAAAYHEKLVSRVFFEEEFKTCTGCGRTLLRDADNFTRKSRSKDGLSTRCKRCEKETRLRRSAAKTQSAGQGEPDEDT